MWRGQVAEAELGPFVIHGPLPDLKDVPGADGSFAFHCVRQHIVHEPLIQGQLSTVAGDTEHVVLLGVHLFVPHRIRPGGQLLHHVRLYLGRFHLLHMKFRLRNRQFQHIGGLNIRHLPEHVDQLRKVVEPGEPGLGPVTGALRGQLDGRDSLSKVGGPGIKLADSIPLQRLVLEIPLHGKHLHHGVADRSARGEHHTMAVGDLVQIPAFHEHNIGPWSLSRCVRTRRSRWSPAGCAARTGLSTGQRSGQRWPRAAGS